MPAVPDLSALVHSGARIDLRVTPRARREAIEPGTTLRVFVTAPATGGLANEAARRLLARALGIAPSRLTLLRGAASRDKTFGID